MNYPNDFINKIIHGDCIEIMKYIPDNSIDLVFTSPPFKDEDVEGNYWDVYDKWFQEMYRITSKCLITIHSATKINKLAALYPPKRWMIWGKGIVAYAWRFNPILVYQKSDNYKVNKFIYSDTIGITPIKGVNKNHKYQDPLELYKTIIKMFKGCEHVLDPFIGSGTTAKACIELNKIFTGIEIDGKSYNLACENVYPIMKEHET